VTATPSACSRHPRRPTPSRERARRSARCVAPECSGGTRARGGAQSAARADGGGRASGGSDRAARTARGTGAAVLAPFPTPHAAPRRAALYSNAHWFSVEPEGRSERGRVRKMRQRKTAATHDRAKSRQHTRACTQDASTHRGEPPPPPPAQRNGAGSARACVGRSVSAAATRRDVQRRLRRDAIARACAAAKRQRRAHRREVVLDVERLADLLRRLACREASTHEEANDMSAHVFCFPAAAAGARAMRFGVPKARRRPARLRAPRRHGPRRGAAGAYRARIRLSRHARARCVCAQRRALTSAARVLCVLLAHP
jgi:hypothetical protein